MSKIIQKVVFLLVLAGLLTWGVATMAQGPAVNTIGENAIQMQGQVMENGIEVSPENLHHVN